MPCRLNGSWGIPLGFILLLFISYLGIVFQLFQREVADSFRPAGHYWSDEVPNDSNSTGLYWMKRPTILSRMSFDWNVDLNRIIKRCDRTKVSDAACLRYITGGRQDFMVKRKEEWRERNETMIHHAFWGGKWTDKLSLFCKSWVFSQRLGKAQLWVWMSDTDGLESTKTNPLSSMFMPFSEVVSNTSEPHGNKEEMYIVFRKFEWKFIHQSLGEFENFKQNTFQFESDMFRVAILYQYGGMYLDVDSLLLRDLGDLYLSGKEFAYEWASKGLANTAVFYLNKRSNTGKAIIEGAMNLKHWFSVNPPFHPWHYLEYVFNSKLPGADLMILPCALFDPIWLTDEKSAENLREDLSPPFKKIDDVFTWKIDVEQPRIMTNFLAGAWALHWHGNNKWDRSIHKESWMGLWNTLFDCFIEKECQNLYGEMLKIERKHSRGKNSTSKP
eukprot:TRINITY_DN6537_c0_g1_i1.p1 TRINITY_DN6537_c0_g1~~TRINITY_DN6537_c0_g1_i1.p1  ORF type:complete len:443 (+),score=100.11 TRINITY_DN6537_c0_g1_i1:45-1373(+)